MYPNPQVSIFLLFCLLMPALLSAQSSLLDFTHYTTADGLPSSETYFAYEDSRGLMWVGTDNGLARYNGYEFEVFDADDGLEDSVVFMIHEDTKGRIWVSTLTGRVFYLSEGRFHSFAQNEVLLSLKKNSELFYLLDIWPEGDVIMRINYEGIIRVSPDGAVEWLTEENSNNYYIYRTRDPGSHHPRQARLYYGQRYSRSYSQEGPVLVYGQDGWEPYGNGTHRLNNLSPSRVSCLDLGEGGVLITEYNRLIHLFPDGRRYEFPLKSRPDSHILPFGGNQYLISGVGGNGLRRLTLNYSNETVQLDTFLAGRSLSMVNYDHRGGLWVASLDAGLFYCPYPHQEMFVGQSKGLAPHPTALAVIDSANVAGGFADGNLILYNNETKRQQPVKELSWNSGYQADDVHYDRQTNSLFWLDRYIRLNDEREVGVKSISTYEKSEKKGLGYSMKEFSRIGDATYWTGTQNFGSIDPETNTYTTFLEADFYAENFAHGFESFYVFPDGRRFVGTWYGLKELTDSLKLISNDLGIPELSDRIERIIGWGDDRIVIGTRGSGLVIWSAKEHFLIGRQQGLASNNIRNLHVTADGNLWVATLEGLSKLRPFAQGGEPHVRTFNIGNGLIDNEVHDMDSYQNQLWLASTKGIYPFVEPGFDSLSTAPQIKQIVVNGEQREPNQLLNLKSKEDNLSISYGSTIFSLGDQLRYRYRIDPDPEAPWQITSERTANFPSLGPGEYRFEVQAENQDGVWSESSMLRFSKQKAWIRTWQPWALGFVGLTAGLLIYFRRREQERLREERYQREIQRLEHSALHAQMNPHFVFNSLNSIQNFILHNDTRQAATYLARFARLIRQTLRSSVRGAHSLADEVEMLDRYLELEKLRFKDVFDYEITIDDGLDRDAINVPPLLIQPFVENAILHGFKEVAEGGELNIRIGGTPELLVVTVTDNGVGIDPARPVGEDSLGMSITRQRLNLVRNREHPRLSLDIKPLVLPDGTLGGTEVTLCILPVTEPAATN